MKAKQKKKRAPEPAKPAHSAIEPLSPQSVFFALALATVILISFTIVSYDRNRVYQSPVTLWADASAKSANKRRTHENYGQALSTAGFYKEALKEFKTVLALKDDGSVPMRDVYREIGVVYFRLGIINDAIGAWQTGLQYAPFDPSLLNNLSVAFLQQKRFEEAEKTIRQALAGAPSMPQALNSLGEILMLKGHYAEAANHFLRAIEVSPDAPSRYWNAALALERTGKYDLAFDYANRYVAMEPNPELKQRGIMFLSRLQSLYRQK